MQDDNMRLRPLHYAAMKVHISIAKELFDEMNADIIARDYGGDAALSWAKDE